MSADDSSLPTHEECALAIFSFDSDDRLALLRHLGEDDLSDRAELELGRILAFYTANAPRRLQVGLRDFRARASFPLPLALDEQQRIQRGDLPHDHWSLRAGGGDRDDGGYEVGALLIQYLSHSAISAKELVKRILDTS